MTGCATLVVTSRRRRSGPSLLTSLQTQPPTDDRALFSEGATPTGLHPWSGCPGDRTPMGFVAAGRQKPRVRSQSERPWAVRDDPDGVKWCHRVLGGGCLARPTGSPGHPHSMHRPPVGAAADVAVCLFDNPQPITHCAVRGESPISSRRRVSASSTLIICPDSMSSIARVRDSWVSLR